jgi:surface polysaccharide O-acyltransferase-like enzyme
MLRDDETSLRIEILRFPLIVGVVFLHNYDTTVPLAQGLVGVAHNSIWVEFVRFFISRGVAAIAVPLFFAVSGYLFFLGEWSREKFFGKLKRRLRTLLIPFLFWNVLTLAVFAIAESIPQTQIYFAGSVWPPVRSFSRLDYVNALFGITAKFPVAFQFWFIRDLMALVLLAPATHFLLARRSALPFILALFGLWFSTVWPILWPSVEASFFFCLGAYLAWPGKSVTYLDKFGPWIFSVFLGLLILHSALPDRLPYLHKVVIAFGVPTLWWLTGPAVRMAKLKSLLIKLSSASFFVFAAHEPLLMIIRKVLYKQLLPTGGAAILALYFSIPICLLLFLVLTHRCLLKIVPSFVGFISGSSYRPHISALEAR